jgi:hypothetical protein
VLHAFAGKFAANLGEKRFAHFAVIGKDTHFDECVGCQRQIDFVQYRGRESFVSDHHNGVKVMRRSAQGATRAARE